MAAVLLGGPPAMLSHRSAAELWGLLEPIEGPVHVTIGHGRSGADGVRFHGSCELGQRTTRAGVPLTTIPQTLLDLAGVVSASRLRGAYDDADRRSLLDRSALDRLCQPRSGRRGLRAMRDLLDERPIPVAETRSHLERRFLRFCRERRLPIPAVNVPVAGYEVDCLWPPERVVVELDSWSHHGSRDAFEADRRRDARIQLAGYRIVRVTHRRISDGADELEAQIRGLLQAGWRG
jgi:very-short-patch-repair endonuclease